MRKFLMALVIIFGMPITFLGLAWYFFVNRFNSGMLCGKATGEYLDGRITFAVKK